YAVNSISIHPSGKLALSVSKDKTLRTWNLIKGRSAYITNIKKVAELVRWSPDGSHFLVAFRNAIDVYSVESAAVVQTIDFKQKICDLTFIKDEIIAVGGESEDIRFYDVKSGELIHTFNAHKSRVKALECVSVNSETFLVSTSSDGYIKVWYLDVSESEIKAQKIAKVNTGSRPTCLTVLLK
ncbi:p21-activated protein kinase-interacting protein 1-like, partial [Stegodyphus dumicola]|uniref:p21-activated protein kinase-interacting protein 1-like n=1 Tax=Stegodyphus dumicola TaxID=202533 RepID=UPI0015AD2005